MGNRNTKYLLFVVYLLFSYFSLGAQNCESSDLEAQDAGVPPTLCGSCDGSASVIASGGAPPYTYQWSTGETTPVIGTSQTGTALCINAGGPSVAASSGNTFTADQFSSGGTAFSNAIPIANTTDDAIFQDERFVGNGGFFSYNIPVTNGNYLVEFYFAEIFFGTSPERPGGIGSRVFDVSIEGVLVLDDYDIFLDAGGAAIAVIKSFNMNVTDGTLNILFDGVVDNAKINALCVTPVSAAGLCAGNYSVTVTDSTGCTATATVALDEGNCNDDNLCTTDTCDNGQCSFTALTCDDQDSCTTDNCVDGNCIFSAIPDCADPCANILCDDEDPCTADACIDGNCENTPLNCNDNNLCTIDSCFSTFCVYIPIECNDGDSCTIDFCDNGNCLTSPKPGCGDPCANIICDDEDACTTDSCNKGNCTYTTLHCDDSDSCTTDTCDNGNCSHTLIPGCNDPCDTVNCDDNDACTVDACSNGQCQYAPLNCNDNDACTVDDCLNGCTNLPLNCDDGDSCTLDGCEDGGCTHTFVGCCQSNNDCLDNDLCTADACIQGVCSNVPRCEDDDLCTVDYCRVDDDDDDGHHHDDDDDDDSGNSHSHGNVGVVHGNGYTCFFRVMDCDDHDKCTTDECVNGECVNTPVVCQDNDPCTEDVCKRNRCRFEAMKCNDDDACTRDSCGGGVCFNTPRDCADEDPCTIDICVTVNGDSRKKTECMYLAIVCDDNNACTADDCDAGNCSNVVIPNCCLEDAACEDDDLCTSDECHDNVCRNLFSALSIAEIPGYCQNGLAKLEASETGASFLWSTGVTTPSIDGQADATYSLTVTTANGCIKTASITVSPLEELLSSYVIVVEDEVKLHRNTVESGGVGATDNHGKVRLKNLTSIVNPGTFVQADNIQISGNSQVSVINNAPAQVDLPPFEFNPYCGDGNNAFIQQNQTVTLSGSVYRNIFVGKNSTVIFTSPDLNIYSLHLKDNVTVEFANCSRVKVCKFVRIGKNNVFNSGHHDVILFVEHDVEIGGGSSVFADIDVRDGHLRVDGSYTSGMASLTGLFIAERLEAKDYATWNVNPGCDESCDAPQPAVALKRAAESDAENGVDIAPGAAGGIYLKSYPNPFTEKLQIEFSLPADAEVKLEIYNLSGQLLATIFEGEVSSGNMQKFEYQPSSAGTSGIVIYRLQTSTGIYFGKAVMVR